MKYILFFLFMFFIASSCVSNKQAKDEPTQSSASAVVEPTPPQPIEPEAPDLSKVKYKVIDEKVNETLNKCEIHIRVYDELSEDILRAIAKKYRAGRENFYRLWIFYYLPGMEPGSGAWATTHYAPDLEVNYTGMR